MILTDISGDSSILATAPPLKKYIFTCLFTYLFWLHWVLRHLESGALDHSAILTCLCWVLVAECELSCAMQDLVP